MILLWILDAGLTMAGWYFSLFDALPVLDLPTSPTIVGPVPFLGATVVSNLNVLIPVAVLVALALVVGKVLQWFYALIPFKMT